MVGGLPGAHGVNVHAPVVQEQNIGLEHVQTQNRPARGSLVLDLLLQQHIVMVQLAL